MQLLLEDAKAVVSARKNIFVVMGMDISSLDAYLRKLTVN